MLHRTRKPHFYKRLCDHPAVHASAETETYIYRHCPNRVHDQHGNVHEARGALARQLRHLGTTRRSGPARAPRRHDPRSRGQEGRGWWGIVGTVQELLDTLFAPLEGLDIGYLYDRYHTGIDFAFYILILVPVCRFALSRHFPDPHGRKLASVLGIILAISLSAAEQTLGFSLRAFGPVAAGLVVFAFAVALYNLVRTAGAGHAASGSLALIVTYLCLRAVAPGLFDWAKENQWASYLHLVFVIAVLIAFWRLIASLSVPHELRRVNSAVLHSAQASSTATAPVVKQVAAERQAVKHQLRDLVVRGKRECNTVISILDQVRRALHGQALDQAGVEAVCRALTDIKQREHVIESELAKLQALATRLLNADFTMYRDLRQRYGQLTPERQAQCKRLVVEEVRKLNLENTIRALLGRTQEYSTGFDRCVDGACVCLRAGDWHGADGWLERAIAHERVASQVLDAIRAQAAALFDLVQAQVRQLEQAATP